MTRNWLLCGTAIALLTLAACDPGTDDAASDDPTMDGQVDQRAGTRPGQAEFGPAPLAPIDHSGVTGTVAADRDDDDVTVTLSMEGLQPGATYLAHIHEDRCAMDGPARVPLGRITAGDDGMATVDLRADAAEMPAGEEWSVQVEAETGESVACATLRSR